MCLCSLIPCLYISGHIFSIWECVSATQDGREWWSCIKRVAVSARAWFDQFPQTTPSARTRCPRCELARRVFVLIQYQGKPVSPYSLIAMNIYMFQNITNTWFKVWKCCSKHSSSDSIPVKITLTFRLFQQIDALIWLRFDWSVIKGANLNMHLQTGANFFLSYSVAGPLDLNLCVC